MKPDQVLFVAWQDPDSRRILPIGRVTFGSGGYEFVYIKAAKLALDRGFLPLLSFPNIDQAYRSREMMPLLHNRLVQHSRPDYQEYLDQLGLNATPPEAFEVLSRSGGRRTTDKLELFGPPSDTGDGQLCSVVLARGIRHVVGAEASIASLENGAQLSVQRDSRNEHNPHALKLEHHGTTIGFLPDYLANELSGDPSSIRAVVLKVNLPPAPVHHRLLVAVTFPASSPRPFSGLSYQPMSADGSLAA